MEAKINRKILLSEDFLLNIMPHISGDFTKIYIFSLYLTEKYGAKTDVQTLCDISGFKEGYVESALKTLCSYGVLKMYPDKTVESIKSTNSGEKYKSNITKALKNEPEVSNLIAVAEKILAKTISASAAEKIYSFYDWLGMPTDLIVRLLEYCAEIDRRDMRYIEKVAISWSEMGISSVDEAEAYIKIRREKRSYRYKAQEALGIELRKLTAAEEKYIEDWFERKISIELIEFAYDYSVSKTNKFAAAYINRVLTAWNESGIKTPSQAQAAIDRFSKNRTAKKTASASAKPEVYGSGRYDYEKLDELARRKLKDKLKEEQI